MAIGYKMTSNKPDCSRLP